MTLKDVIQLVRPHHWVKNGFVLAGLLFGHAWHDPALVAAALAATAAFCLVSSAVYAFNDALDAARDREHPEKNSRPVARGAISVAAAHAIGALTFVIGVVFWFSALRLPNQPPRRQERQGKNEKL